MLRRLHKEQPDSFAFTADNLKWAEAQMTKYPEGRQASAIIPLLWRAQEQEGWLTRPAIEYVADMLGMAYIRALEVATFYFMFQLQPVGSIAHVQICGTTSCMICGAEDLISVCKDKIAAQPHALSSDGKLSWEEVECLGACANAPMAQIGKDYYEDLTAESFAALLDDMAAGKVPAPGPQNGRYTSEPASGLTSLKDHEADKMDHNASVALALGLGDTLKRIDGTEVPFKAPWNQPGPTIPGAEPAKPVGKPAHAQKAVKAAAAKKEKPAPAEVEAASAAPKFLSEARESGAEDLKKIKGVGPKLEKLLHSMGVYHMDQIAAWSEAEVAWVDDNLEGFKGRVSRDKWVEQAKLLSSGAETEFSKRVKDGDVY